MASEATGTSDPARYVIAAAIIALVHPVAQDLPGYAATWIVRRYTLAAHPLYHTQMIARVRLARRVGRAIQPAPPTLALALAGEVLAKQPKSSSHYL